MINFYEVDVDCIESKHKRSEFDIDQIEQLSDLILQSGALIRPLILKQSGPESYEVADGDLEYFAAVRAKEKNLKGEVVNAFVVADKAFNLVNQQMDLLSRLRASTTSSIVDNSLMGKSSDNSNESITAFNTRLTNMECRIDKDLQEMRQQIKQHQQLLAEKLNQQPLAPLEIFNKLDKKELYEAFRRAGIRNKKLNDLIEAVLAERKNEEFVDLSDVLRRVRGMGPKTALSILEAALS